MIDTDKYEGHLAYLDYELWTFADFMNINATHEERCATDALLSDAPLILEAYKRLCKGIKEAIQHLTYPSKYDKEVQEQTDKLKELIG